MDKLGERWDGPFVIKKIHVNGNVTVKLTEGFTETERLNIRRIKPYKSAYLIIYFQLDRGIGKSVRTHILAIIQRYSKYRS